MNATVIVLKSITIIAIVWNRPVSWFAGKSPDNRIVEMMELPEHPWFVAAQFHPEFKSRPNRPHPLFRGFVAQPKKKQKNKPHSVLNQGEKSNLLLKKVAFFCIQEICHDF